jgi:hypothetical protein
LPAAVPRRDAAAVVSKCNIKGFCFFHFQIGFLSVVEAPDILYNETSNDTIVPEGSGVSLRCEAREEAQFTNLSKL